VSGTQVSGVAVRVGAGGVGVGAVSGVPVVAGYGGAVVDVGGLGGAVGPVGGHRGGVGEGVFGRVGGDGEDGEDGEDVLGRCVW